MHQFSDSSRYIRQIPIIGTEGQEKLSKSNVLIVGIGGLGCPLSLYLSIAGIGRLTLIDYDEIEISNLHRQILYAESDIGSSKARAAKEEINKRNAQTNIKILNCRLDEKNAHDLIKAHDVVVDCSDNYDTSYLINSVSREFGVPFVTASIFQDEASISTLNFKDGPCLECIFPERPPLDLIPNCSESGVLGIDAGIVGVMQAKEVANVILGRPRLHKRIMNINLDTFRTKIRTVGKRLTCSQNQCYPKPSMLNCVISLGYDEFFNVIEKRMDIQLIDVRSNREHQENNIGGINIPIEELPKKLSLLSLEKPILIYCNSGKRSIEASLYLTKQGFNEVINLEGGIINRLKSGC